MRRLLLLGCALGAGWGCNAPTYLGEYRTLATTAGMNGALTTDTDTFTIPIRNPTAPEMRALRDEQMRKGLPQAVPWVGVRDLPVEVQYTIRNLDAAPASVRFTLAGGGSEFGLYDPLLYYDPLDPDAVVPPPLLGATPIAVPANGTRSLVFREDDLAEAAADVEAIVRYPGPADLTIPFKVLTGRSDVSPIGHEMVPAGNVTPQVMILTFQLAADRQVTVDYVVRVRDLQNRLAPPGSRAVYR